MGLYGRGASAGGSARRDDDIAWVVSRREIDAANPPLPAHAVERRVREALPAAVRAADALERLAKALSAECAEQLGIRLYAPRAAMVSIYPGDGAAFEPHVDNATRCGGSDDGRRLTMVLYANEAPWDVSPRADGGALRVFPADPTGATTVSKRLPSIARRAPGLVRHAAKC